LNVNKPNATTDWVDPDDAPELTDDFFARADEFIGDRLVRRGRPKAEITKQSPTVRYDQEEALLDKLEELQDIEDMRKIQGEPRKP